MHSFLLALGFSQNTNSEIEELQLKDEVISHIKVNYLEKVQDKMLKYDKEPVRLTPISYKPKDKWRIIEFQFDPQLTNELMDSRKYHTMNE